MSDQFDPASVGRRDRRRVAREIRAATHLTQADRDLRLARADAAQTRGELNSLTRDLGAPVTPRAVAPPVGPQAPSASYRTPPAQGYVPGLQQGGYVGTPQTSRRSGMSRARIIVTTVLLVALCGGGLLVSATTAIIGMVESVLDAADDTTESSSSDDDRPAGVDEVSTSPASLTTADWSVLVDAILAETGQTEVIHVALGQGVTRIVVPRADDGTRQDAYSHTGSYGRLDEGSLQPPVEEQRPDGPQVFDLETISSTSVVQAIQEASTELGTDVEVRMVTLDVMAGRPALSTYVAGTAGRSGYRITFLDDGSTYLEAEVADPA